jgi:hypothetical protein
MPDLQSNNIEISGSTYKDFLLTRNTENKLDPKYGLKLAQDIESKYSAGTANGYTYLRNDRIKANILWASGKINIKAKFADQLALNAKINYANINWKAPFLVNRIISGLVGRWMQRQEKIQVTAIDPISIQAKQEQYEQAEVVFYNRKQLEQLQQESGVPMIPQDQFVAEDKDDLEEWAITGQKLPEEIKYETGTNDILEIQGWFDTLKQKSLWDAATAGLVSAYVWMDENGLIHVEWIKALNTLYSYSEYDDFRDTAMRGFVKSLKISEIRRKYGKEFGGKLTEEELFQLAQTCQEYQRFDKLTWNYDWLLAYTRPYDEWNIECMYFWIKSVDEDGYLMTVTKQNKSTIIERRQQAPPNLGDNQEYTKKDKWNLYKGVFARTAVKMLEWGLDNNMIRPQDPKESGDVEFPISLYMYQNQDMRNVAIPEKIEEPVEQMILARLKIQQIVATLVPPGAMINVDAMQELNLGLAADGETPINPQKVYEQTGRLYYRGRDAEGNPIPVPIQELQNSGFVNQMNGLIALYEYHYKVLKDELGEDPNLLTAAVQPRVTSDNVAVSQQQADFATGYVYDAYRYLLTDIAKKVACLLNNSVRFGATAYRHLMQQEDVKDRHFSTKFRLLPDAAEIQRFEGFINQQLAANPELALYIDSFKLIRIAKEDVKLAELYFKNSTKKMRRAMQQQKQQDIENNAKMQQQSAEQAAAAQKQLQQDELNAAKELEEFKALQQMKVKLLEGSMTIASKLENPEMPSWLIPVIQQLIPNMTIPMALQNKQMVENIQMQEAQEQQEMQQQAPEEQEMAPEQAEQQMQLQ